MWSTVCPFSIRPPSRPTRHRRCGRCREPRWRRRHFEPQRRGYRERLDPQGCPGRRLVRQSGRQRRDPHYDQKGQCPQTATRDVHFEPYAPVPLQPACVPEPLRGERRGGKLGRPCADEDLRQCGRFFPDGDHGDECGLGFLRVGTGAELFFLCQYGRAGNHGFEPLDAP